MTQTLSAINVLRGLESPPTVSVLTRRCRIVICLVSSHGLGSLFQVLQALRPAFPVPVLIVPDRFTTFPNALRFVLEEHSLAQVRIPKQGDSALPGSIYLVPGDVALTIDADQRFSVSTHASHGTFEATDELLSSAAHAYEGRVAALILTSAAITGTEGIHLIREQGGLALTADDFEIETPADFDCGRCIVDYWLPRETIAPVLNSLVLERPAKTRPFMSGRVSSRT